METSVNRAARWVGLVLLWLLGSVVVARAAAGSTLVVKVLPASVARITQGDIARVEYFIDADPGLGNGTAVPLTTGPNVSGLTFSVNLSGLTTGFHRLSTRARDVNGMWSLTTARSFYIPLAPTSTAALVNITKAEYFIDADPGLGSGINLPVPTPATNVSGLAFTVDLTTLTTGFHRITTRSRDANGVWSLSNTRSFYYQPASATPPAPGNITRIEYYFDTDPGFGSATSVPVPTPAPNVANVGFAVDLSGLSDGAHRLFIRSRDANSKWSLVSSSAFTKSGCASSLNFAASLPATSYVGTNTSGTLSSATNVASAFNTDPASPNTGNAPYFLTAGTLQADLGTAQTISEVRVRLTASGAANSTTIQIQTAASTAGPFTTIDTYVAPLVANTPLLVARKFTTPVSARVLRLQFQNASSNYYVVVSGAGIFNFQCVTVTPSITSLTPNSGPVGTSFTVNGANLQGTTQLTFAGPSNNTVTTGFAVSADGKKITGVVVPTGAITGNLTATTPNGTSNGVNFTVSAQPSLTSITPASGVAGTTVTLNGANLGGATTITFTGTSNNIVTTGFAVNSAGTQITGIVVPSGTATGNVTVTTPGGTSSGLTFTVTAAPVISSFSPASGPVGTSVTVTGTNLSGTSAVAFNGTAAPGYVVNANGTQLTVAVPTGASTGPVTVTTPGGKATSATSFTVTATAPSISAFSPAYVQPGDALTITGQNLQGLTQLKIGGAVQPNFTVNAAGTQITTTVPGASYVVNGTTYPLTSRLLAVTTPSGTAASATKLRIFSVTGYYDGAQGYATPPSQVQAGLYRLRTGDQVFVRGSGFLGVTGAAFVAGTTTGCGSTAPLAATPTILNDSMLYVPFRYNLAGNGFFTTGVSITTSLGSQTPQGYSGNAYFFNPQIDSPFASCLSPTSGPASTRVTVTGSWSFGGNSATGLTFNGVAGQNFTASTTGTQQTVSADLPASLNPGAIAVRVTGSGPGFASATDLSVVLSFILTAPTAPPAPALSSLSATSGPVGTSLTITGTNLSSTSSITFAGTSNNTVTTGFAVNAAGTQLTGVVVPTGAQTGNVTVTTPGGNSNGLAFNLILPPVLTSFTPASGPVGTSVTLSGQHLSATSAVAFNGTAATGYVVNAAGTQVTVAVPTGASTGPVSITTPGGKATSATSFTVTVPMALTLAITGTGTAQTGSQYCVAATVKDQFNNPVVGVRVDFAVSGVNSTSGFATTDAKGVAPFCYAGTNAGTDNVVANLGGLSKTVQVTWSGSCQAPTNVAITSITSTTASVSFAGSGTASGGYTVRYTPGGGAAQTAQATASPVALAGLTPNTTYAVTVTSNCAGTQTATSTPAVSFTTAKPSPGCNRNENQPVAATDHLVASAGPLTFTAAQLLANDTDPRNRTLRVAHVGQPSAGKLVTNADGTYTYTAPWPGYAGAVTFSYTIEGTGPVLASSGTYHYYEFVSAPGIRWTDAQAAAATRTYEGMQGYLATITFAGEKDFLAGRALGQYWIGAADDAVEGEWRWKTGPEAGQLFWRGAASGIGSAYANWSPGEPNNFQNFGHPEGEDYGIFYGSSGYWNDANDSNSGSTTAGYLVEYGGLEPCVPILYSLGTVTIMVGPSAQQSQATATAALRAAASEPALQVAPNPSTGQFRVQMTADLAGPAQLDLFDVQGRLVRSLFTGSLAADESHEVAVDAPDLSSGVYIVRLQRGQQVQHLRVLIQK